MQLLNQLVSAQKFCLWVARTYVELLGLRLYVTHAARNNNNNNNNNTTIISMVVRT